MTWNIHSKRCRKIYQPAKIYLLSAITMIPLHSPRSFREKHAPTYVNPLVRGTKTSRKIWENPSPRTNGTDWWRTRCGHIWSNNKKIYFYGLLIRESYRSKEVFVTTKKHSMHEKKINQKGVSRIWLIQWRYNSSTRMTTDISNHWKK